MVMASTWAFGTRINREVGNINREKKKDWMDQAGNIIREVGNRKGLMSFTWHISVPLVEHKLGGSD
jgi:hypothetical protein